MGEGAAQLFLTGHRKLAAVSSAVL
ncbi:MAG: hypothetical protein QOF60_1688, partial [Actinomycetota bacterium]|nr:hypothetical protein [Actinomycetota bacterium]